MKKISVLFVLFFISLGVLSAQDEKSVKNSANNSAKVGGANSTQAVNVAEYNFTTSATAYYGGTAACKFVGINSITGDSTFAMIAGDANSDGVIDAVDKNSYWRVQNGTTYEYSKNSDFNLDANLDAVDKNSYWRPNNGKSTQVPN